MAGEWIAYDLALPAKPEVQELIDVTGQPVEVVVYRLLQLWGWAAINTGDGTARMTLPRLVRTCGADEEFWRAVAAVGWLEIDETAATVAIPGWDRRFSQAAKSRIQHADRAAAQNEREPDRRRRAGAACAQAQPPAAPPRSRGEEIEENSSPPTREASPGDRAAGWRRLRDAWNAGSGREWKPAGPPDMAELRLVEPGWLDEAVEAIGRLPACRYFTTAVTLPQFCGPGFVRRVLGGQYDDPKQAKGAVPVGDSRRAAADVAEEWKRGAAESARRNAEYLAAKAARKEDT